VKHYTSSDFWALYWALPVEIRELAEKNYQLLKENPRHRSLQLKRVEELWSVRVGKHYRAIGIDAPGGIQWIGLAAMLSATSCNRSDPLSVSARIDGLRE
jgi:hypothetical protein